jgi:signal transduction histidine kinase
MISTVFRNLIFNAIKFTHSGEIIISAIEKQNEIIFSISDTGVGIPKNNIEKLFRLDQNYSTLGTNNETGTGMGLILCKEFIEREGGKIWVESEVGKGSIFYFTIPQPRPSL